MHTIQYDTIREWLQKYGILKMCGFYWATMYIVRSEFSREFPETASARYWHLVKLQSPTVSAVITVYTTQLNQSLLQ